MGYSEVESNGVRARMLNNNKNINGFEKKKSHLVSNFITLKSKMSSILCYSCDTVLFFFHVSSKFCMSPFWLTTLELTA